MRTKAGARRFNQEQQDEGRLKHRGEKETKQNNATQIKKGKKKK